MSTSRTGAPPAKPISEDEIRSLLDHYRCPMPFHVVRTRLLGNIASPDMTASPMDTVAGLSGGELPAIDNVDALRGMTPISDRDRPNLSAGEALASRSKPQPQLRLRTTLQSSLARSRGCQFYWQCTAAAQADYIVIRHREQRHFPAGPCGATQVMSAGNSSIALHSRSVVVSVAFSPSRMRWKGAGDRFGCYARSPAINCWANNVNPVIGPSPLGRSNTNTRS